MKYYVHINTLYDSQKIYSKNELKSFQSVEDMFYFVRDLIFHEDLDEDEYLNTEPLDLFEDLNIEVSIFNEEMENIFNFGKSHDNTWGDFESKFKLNEMKIVKYTDFFESKGDKFPNIKKLQIDGFSVYIGKDAKSNDYLTFNIADKEDIWLHVKGVPGSHVVVRVREKLPTEYIIRQVAELAKKNSKASKESSVTVVYCQRRFVKKEPGMNDGQVRVDYINAYEIKI